MKEKIGSAAIGAEARGPSCARKGSARAALALSVLFALPAREAAAQPPDSIGVGAGEADRRGHLAFPGAPRRLIAVSARVMVDEAPDVGLNFFAVQVNFPNKTWAHGGLQYNDGQKWRANWGGLVNRGGGRADYVQTDPASDLMLMQNGEGLTTRPYAWSMGRAYVIAIERGERKTFPAGDYVFIGKGPPVSVVAARVMWEWRLTITPEDKQGEPYRATLYDAADSFNSFFLWNECSRSSCERNVQHATWSTPVYRSLDAPHRTVAAPSYRRF